ncbi:cytidine deaminase-like protein [Mycena belliarum]|uniref:Cytidine deaminase-like protein n=1 Tax=Mycena belliarum TaxID=1033014 RepID=A0AAD6XVQ5_9AGAR|nr:cytidine deaminase-like protein [Mycena belliae]
MDPASSLTEAPQPYPNEPNCIVGNSEGKGRGVFGYQTVVEISPVLLLGKEEYEAHGRFTILDDYTFKWKNGSMALALGLGSLFNHSNFPNLSYAIDTSSDSIRYTTTRNVKQGEELCIYYGSNLWFEPARPGAAGLSSNGRNDDDDEWGGLSRVEILPDSLPAFFQGSMDDTVQAEDLPFERFKPPPEEETLETLRTGKIFDSTTDNFAKWSVFQWLRRSELDASELGHLKRVRKQGDTSTFLLSVSALPPTLPKDISLPPPFLVTVPASVALTPTSLNLKTALWPTVYAPRRKGEIEEWSKGKARWAWDAMHVVVREALQWRERGELPIAAYVPPPYEVPDGASSPPAFMAHDTRQSATHPLRHAVMNVIRHIADERARAEAGPGKEPVEAQPDAPSNGTNYLLTSQTLFTTHEPCIMCSMALLHSRVKEVVYLFPMDKTGGCGGVTCLPTLPGVNHRFTICRWKEGLMKDAGISLDDSTDA